MEATDAADLISEIRDEMREERAEHASDERFRNVTALVIAIMAVLLAIASLGGGNVGEDMIHNNISASDTWAFYQAKNVRQTSYKLAVDDLQALLAASPTLSGEARAQVEAKIADYRATIARYDDEPDAAAPSDPLRGEGKKQLSAQARSYEQARERAAEQDANFDYSSVLLQIAIVMGSVAILANSRKVLWFAVTMAMTGTMLMVNGFYLFVHLPF
ncbi:MAG TPA: DUF4337 domain-containing protein [Longimicrobium sp.]|jgi:hypothetical protein